MTDTLIKYIGRFGKKNVFSVLITLCIAVFGVIVGAYIHSFNRQFTEESSLRLAEVSDTIVTHLTTVVHDTQAMLRIVATSLPRISGTEARLAYLRNIADQFGFVYLGYAGQDGLLHATIASESRSIAQTPGFQAALQGKSVVSDHLRKIFKNYAASGILLTVPLTLDGQKGAVLAMLETRKLREGLKLESFGKKSRTYIINPQGAVIMRARSMDLGNLFTGLRNAVFIGNDLDSLMYDIQRRRQGIASYMDLAQTRQFLYYQPLRFNDWTAITVVPEHAVLSKRALDMTRELALVGTGLILLFMGIMLWIVHAYNASQASRIAMNAKSAFLANMSHEIRTPMNAVVGLSEILLREEMPPSQRDRLVRILNAGKGLLTIIDDILDLTKIESGKFAIIAEPYALETLLNDITTIAAMRIGHKPVQFGIEIDPALPRTLTGDMGRVKQVLINLVNNAIKFTEKGSVCLIIGGEQRDESWQLRMEVKDTGIGIRPEDLGKLFVSFNQVDTRRNRKIKGTGLGLAISRKLCEMMGGTITVSSVYGQGTSFVTCFPQGIADPAPLLAPLPEGVCLLLCDPCATTRALEMAALQRTGASCDICDTPDTFRERLSTGAYTHALAPRALLHDLTAPEGVQLIGLLGLQDSAPQDREGTTVYQPLFALQLPHALDANTAPGHARLGKKTIEPLPFVSVLIVDDNEINVEVAEGLMEVYGMHMDHAFSGAEALRALQQHDYDLIFMDHMMPDMDGVETTRRIRALPDAKYRHLPIVALTANVTQEMQQLFLSSGFTAFLAKPIEIHALDTVLRTHLKALNDRRASEQTSRGGQSGEDVGGTLSSCAGKTAEHQDACGENGDAGNRGSGQQTTRETAPAADGQNAANEPAVGQAKDSGTGKTAETENGGKNDSDTRKPAVSQAAFCGENTPRKRMFPAAPKAAATGKTDAFLSPEAGTALPEERSFAAATGTTAAAELDVSEGLRRIPAASYPRMLALYRRTTAKTLDALSGWLDNDPERVVIEVHGIKSASASIGALRFSEQARHIELLGRQQAWDKVRAELPGFIEHGRLVLQHIDTWLARHPNGTTPA